MKVGGFHLLLLLLSMQCLYADSINGQKSLHQEMSLTLDNQSLGQVLDEIEQNSELQFTYSIQKIDLDQKIGAIERTGDLEDLLKSIFGTLDIKYTLFGENRIVLSRGPSTFEVNGISLIGQLKNTTGEPLQFANVILNTISEIPVFVCGTVTDEFGKFFLDDLKTGNYQLSASFIGYESQTIEVLIDNTKDLGVLTLIESETLLDELSIRSRRKLFRQQIDRLIVDVENSMLAGKGTAYDVLAATPGVNAQNDRISMIGKSSVGIMIDEKLINLPENEIANYLRSISSESIKNVEVISTPPSKYEAQGNSGLINIVLKKAKLDSWNSQISAGFLARTENSYNGGINFNYNKNKLSVSSSIFGSDAVYNQEQDDYAYFDDGLWYTSSPFRNKLSQLNAKFDVGYQLTKKWNIGAQYIQNDSDFNITDTPYTPVFDYETNEIIQSLQSTKSVMSWKPKFQSINLYNQIDIDTLGKKVKLNLDFFGYKNDDVRSYEGVFIRNEPTSVTQYYAGFNENEQKVNNSSVALDFEFPASMLNLSFGAKVSSSVSGNNISLFNSGFQDEAVINLPGESNDFEYTENIQALYISGTRPITGKWSAKVGFRLEATQTESVSNNLELDTDLDYLRIFPTAYLNYQKSESESISLSYSKRISRPNFWQLNPNIFFINPFQTIEGNAFLQPSFTDNIELSLVKGSKFIKLYYSNEKDVFAQVPLPDSNTNIINFTNKNYVNVKRYGITGSIVYDDLSWWSSSNSINSNYNESNFNLPESHDILKGWNSEISTSNDFSIPQLKGVSFNIGYSYNFRGTYYIFDHLPYSNLSAAIRVMLLDNNLKISLSGNDLTKNTSETTEATINGIFQTARYYYDSRSLYLSVSYSFGNNNIASKRHKTGNQEERRRTGN